MNRAAVIIGVLVSVLLSIAPVYGADILYRLTHNGQDALVIGKIRSQNGRLFQLDVERVISGRLGCKALSLKADFEYSLLLSQPKVGDLCVASLQRIRSGYRIQWGVYKVATLDKQLKFEKTGLSDGLKADLTAMEWYINSNGKATDFYFDGTNGVKAYLRQENGQSRLIYPE